ncbi:MAG: AAA family ATPase [Pseudomonadota bacterium]
MADTLTFRSISLQNWRQFSAVDILVHPRLTVITGTNGSGKSTILNIFSQHFGFSRPLLATPRLNKDGSFFNDLGFNTLMSGMLEDVSDARPSPQYSGRFIQVVSVTYSNFFESAIGLTDTNRQAFGLEIQNQQQVQGVGIGSHRILPNYKPVDNISLQPMRASLAYTLYNQEVTARYGDSFTRYSPIYRLKEALIGMAAFGEGNSYLQPDPQILDNFQGFMEILKKVLPTELGFESISIRIPDVVLKTRSGEFMLDASSGGLNAVIELSWQIYMFSRHLLSENIESFVVTMDEPENHLHPSMQRTILPNLLNAFPKVQFIVATHSPFVVSAVEDSSVYVLKYSDGSPEDHTRVSPLRKTPSVNSFMLDDLHKGGTAAEILREVLGVPVTTPQWVEERLKIILSSFEGAQVDQVTIDRLRGELEKLGFDRYFPEALSKLFNQNG